jgi:hypothetical protein
MIRVIKSWRISWAGHVARMDETRNAYKILVGNLKGEDIEVDLKETGHGGFELGSSAFYY